MATLTTDSITKIMGSDGKERQFIVFQRAKTGRRFEIPLTDKLQDLIFELRDLQRTTNNYLLPIIRIGKISSENDLIKHINSQRQRMNKYLGKIAEEKKFPESIKAFTTYTSRHSYAQFLYNQNAPIAIISEALGHSDIETTRINFSDSGNTRLEEWDEKVQSF